MTEIIEELRERSLTARGSERLRLDGDNDFYKVRYRLIVNTFSVWKREFKCLPTELEMIYVAKQIDEYFVNALKEEGNLARFESTYDFILDAWT